MVWRNSRARSFKICVDENSLRFLFCVVSFDRSQKSEREIIVVKFVLNDGNKRAKKSFMEAKKKRLRVNSSVVDKFALCDFEFDLLVSAERVISVFRGNRKEARGQKYQFQARREQNYNCRYGKIIRILLSRLLFHEWFFF